MWLRLDDNAREALQFLLLGAGLILAVRGIHYMLDHLWTPGPSATDWDLATEAFRDGYLIPVGTLVGRSVPVITRAGAALLVTLFAGGAAALIAAGLAGVLHRDRLTWTVSGARSGLLISAAWCLFAILRLPPTEFRPDPSGLVQVERTALWGAVTLPVPPVTGTIPWAGISAIHDRTRRSSLTGCGHVHEVTGLSGGREIRFARSIPSGTPCAEAVVVARGDCDRLVHVLRARSSRRSAKGTGSQE